VLCVKNNWDLENPNIFKCNYKRFGSSDPRI